MVDTKLSFRFHLSLVHDTCVTNHLTSTKQQRKDCVEIFRELFGDDGFYDLYGDQISIELQSHFASSSESNSDEKKWSGIIRDVVRKILSSTYLMPRLNIIQLHVSPKVFETPTSSMKSTSSSNWTELFLSILED